jgi:hypothetical protein
MPNFSTISAVSTRYKRRRVDETDKRFETFPDLMNNWMVWDLGEDACAEVGAQRLNSLSEARAKAFCSLLNKLFRGKPHGLGAKLSESVPIR